MIKRATSLRGEADFIQNREIVATNLTGRPLFFIGCSPSQSSTIINPDYPAAGVMVSINQLRDRKSDFEVADWILDSGAFTEVARYGGYRHGVQQYIQQIYRWSKCGKLLCAVAQDWGCEPFVLSRTGLTVAEHQKLTIERYDQLISKHPAIPIMPVLQGYRTSDYLKHLADYGDRFAIGSWIGVGSVCKKNGNPGEVADILRAIKILRPDLRLHGFGLKILALENIEVRELLYSCDSTAWSYPLRFRREGDSVQHLPPLQLANEYQQKIASNSKKRIPRTAGAGNGQGRKPKWKSATTAIRVPSKYADKLISVAKEWEEYDRNH
ncbi:hypothetical protein PN499_26685 [Kamptonema animale CS-326]|jgi:hypothetical protein|uniref:deazapurine DNA modification protein DpdA family protein n=1 Tax=Kamptonema animale TaxID=92934 RepID=UPI00232FEA6B|nr:hypothetical protein [Kamptonema animale]MDB9514795.1 hypothetical protein [Kamptonema animale CS-326]